MTEDKEKYETDEQTAEQEEEQSKPEKVTDPEPVKEEVEQQEPETTPVDNGLDAVMARIDALETGITNLTDLFTASQKQPEEKEEDDDKKKESNDKPQSRRIKLFRGTRGTRG